MAPSFPTVLCVDDEPGGLRLRQIVLEGAGFRVLTASNDQEALALFAAERVDAAVVDLSMPGLGGGGLARQMRALKPAARLVLLSGYLDAPAADMEAVDAFLSKDQPPRELIALLRRLLEPERQRRPA